MGRTGRIGGRLRKAGLWSGGFVTAVVAGWFLVVAPAATAAPTEGVPGGAAVVVLAQAAPPSGQQPVPPAGTQPAPTIDQRTLIGVAGIVLIALVLLSRKARKKPIFGSWRPKK